MFLDFSVYTVARCTSKEKAWNSHYSTTRYWHTHRRNRQAHAILSYSMNIATVVSSVWKVPVFVVRRSANVMLYKTDESVKNLFTWCKDSDFVQNTSKQGVWVLNLLIARDYINDIKYCIFSKQVRNKCKVQVSIYR